VNNNGCGCSSGIAVIIILVVTALVAVGWYNWQQSLQQQAHQGAVERQQLRARQLAVVADDIAEAEQFLEEGHPDRVTNTLQHMDEKLVMLATAANAAGDTGQAQEITSLHVAVTDALEAIEEAEGDEEKLQVARVQLKDLRKALSRAVTNSPSTPQTSPPPGEAADATQ
jgi:predicted negative regulator of RcsB-dependent stress response